MTDDHLEDLKLLGSLRHSASRQDRHGRKRRKAGKAAGMLQDASGQPQAGRVALPLADAVALPPDAGKHHSTMLRSEGLDAGDQPAPGGPPRELTGVTPAQWLHAGAVAADMGLVLVPGRDEALAQPYWRLLRKGTGRLILDYYPVLQRWQAPGRAVGLATCPEHALRVACFLMLNREPPADYLGKHWLS